MAAAQKVVGSRKAAQARTRARDLLADTTPVDKVMSAPAITVPRTMSVESLVAFFLERSISGVPVVDDHSRPVGVVTKTDILREWQDRGDLEEHEPLRVKRGHSGQTDAERRGVMEELRAGFHAERLTRTTAGEIMTPLTFTLPVGTPLARAAALMAFEGVHRLVVVDAAGKVVGVLSAIDILRWTARRAGYVVPGHTQRQGGTPERP